MSEKASWGSPSYFFFFNGGWIGTNQVGGGVRTFQQRNYLSQWPMAGRKMAVGSLVPSQNWRRLKLMKQRKQWFKTRQVSRRLEVPLATIRILVLTLWYICYYPSGSDGKESACKAGDRDSVSGLGRSPGEGHDNPFQHSCLENSMQQRHLVGYSPWGSKSWAWLSEWHFHFHRKYVKDFKWGRDMTRSRFWTDYSDHCMETRLVRLKNGWREKRWASVNNIHELLNRALYSSTNTYHAFTVWEAQWGIKRETNHSFWSLRNLFKMSLFFFIWFAC